MVGNSFILENLTFIRMKDDHIHLIYHDGHGHVHPHVVSYPFLLA